MLLTLEVSLACVGARCMLCPQVKKFPALLSAGEGAWLVGEAEKAAARRGGWHGDRHRGYATTDLRVQHVSPEVASWHGAGGGRGQ